MAQLWGLVASILGTLWSLPVLGQLCLLTLVLLSTWYVVVMERQKSLLRSVHKDVVIITQPIFNYSPLFFIMPLNWFQWLFPYRGLDMHYTLHEIFTRTGARAIGFASPGRVDVYFNDEDIIREMAVKQHEKFPKVHEDYEPLRIWGDNIITAPSDGYEWKKHRNLLTPAFSTDNMRLEVKVTIDNTNALFAKWDQQLVQTKEMGQVADVDVEDDTMRLMLNVIAGAGFGLRMGFEDRSDDLDKSRFSMSFTESMIIVSKHLLTWIGLRSFFKLNLPIARLQRIQQGFVDFEAHVKHLIATRSREQEAAVKEAAATTDGGAEKQDDNKPHMNDLLSLLLKSRAQDARISLTDEEVFSDAFIFLLAGHETTAHTTAWAFAFLATNLHEQDRLHEEVKAVLGDRDPTYEDFDQLIYAQCVFKETLRLMPPVFAIAKNCSEHATLIDHHIKPPVRTTMAIYSIHRNPKYWKEPEVFMPSRFDTRVNPPVSVYHYLPFSLGRRSCIGNRFALVEGTMFLAKLIQKYTIHVPTGTDHKRLLESVNVITLTPRHNMRLWLKKRDSTAAAKS